ncbi:hypothetical protein ACOMHN_003781 [Nucella lapillus]
MSEKRDDGVSEGSSTYGLENPPDPPPESPGSSVSSLLQEEYDELLKYAVVVPAYNPRDVHGKLTDTRQFFNKQNDNGTHRDSPRHNSAFLRNLELEAHREVRLQEREEGETTPRERADSSGGGVKHLPDFGESPVDACGPASFDQHSGADTTGEEMGHPMFPNQAHRTTAAGAGYSPGGSPSPMTSDPLFRVSEPPMETVYTTSIDQDVGKMEMMLEQWCVELKRNVLAEFSHAKIVIEQRSRQDLTREANRHSQEKTELIQELNSLKEFLHTYKLSMERKDNIISNLTHAMYRHRDKMELMRNFCQWKIHHMDSKREAFTMKMAQCHHERALRRRVLAAWFSVIHTKWRQRVEKACQNKAQEICMQITGDYEAKIASLNEAQESSSEEIRRLQFQREKYEETMKKAFMRGVCALNMEAMSMFHGDENTDAPPVQGGREEDFFDKFAENLDTHVPEKGPTSTKAIPHDVLRYSADAPLHKVVTSQGSRSMQGSAALTRPTSARSSSSSTSVPKPRVVTAKTTGLKGSDLGRSGARSLSPSLHPTVASVVVERHQPVTKQTIGLATAAKFMRTTDGEKFQKLAGQQGFVGKSPTVRTVRVVD